MTLLPLLKVVRPTPVLVLRLVLFVPECLFIPVLLPAVSRLLHGVCTHSLNVEYTQDQIMMVLCPFSLSGHKEDDGMCVALLVPCRNDHCACGLELDHDINMFTFTCAWLHEFFFIHHLRPELPLQKCFILLFISVNAIKYKYLNLLSLFYPNKKSLASNN